MRLRRYLNEFLSLLAFLTVIPTGRSDLGEAASGFYLAPLAGFIEGAIASLPLLLGKSLLSASLAVAVLALITGFNHVDGFLDFSEALMSRSTDPVTVLKDKHRGSFAVAAGALLFIVLTSAVSSASDPVIQLIESSSSAAFSMYMLANVSEPAGSGLGRAFILASKDDSKAIASLVIYSALELAVSRSLLGFAIVTAEALAVAYLSRSTAMARLGFVNGDVLGFAYELTLLVTASTMAYLPLSLLPR